VLVTFARILRKKLTRLTVLDWYLLVLEVDE